MISFIQVLQKFTSRVTNFSIFLETLKRTLELYVVYDTRSDFYFLFILILFLFASLQYHARQVAKYIPFIYDTNAYIVR